MERTTDVLGFGRQKQGREKVEKEKQKKETEIGRGGNCDSSLVWRHTFLTPALGKLRSEDLKFLTSLEHHSVTLVQKKASMQANKNLSWHVIFFSASATHTLSTPRR